MKSEMLSDLFTSLPSLLDKYSEDIGNVLNMPIDSPDQVYEYLTRISKVKVDCYISIKDLDGKFKIANFYSGDKETGDDYI